MGRLIVYTGNGKGKTTAALGLALRAIGQGLKVAMVQFIKKRRDTGELRAAKYFNNLFEIFVEGEGFALATEDKERHIKAGARGWQRAKKIIKSRKYQLIILDELTYLISYHMVPEEEILTFLKKEASNVHLVVTGRDASKGLIEAADTVTEMKAIKHAYEKGIKAQKGIEF